jgi:alginate O-acetyltransferase complex protein AlgI
MNMSFLLQTLGPAAFGLLFTLSGLLGGKPRWLGQLAFLVSQLGLIYALGYGSVAGIGLVAVILFGLALSVSNPTTVAGSGRVIAPLLFFLAYVLYWALEKYAVPLVILPNVGSGGAFDAMRRASTLIEIVGISYIGFKLIHFYVDYRAGEIPTVEPLSFLSWLFFLPSIVAGPMQRFQEWQEQFGTTKLTADDAIWGTRRILIGLVMKVGLADNMRGVTLPQLSDGALSVSPWGTLTFAALMYSLYLYLDFAGYCHLAIGTGVFWGIRLPENFANPFIARNLAEFWNRWHMTLSHILRDYLFYPLSLTVKRTRALRTHPYIATAIPPIVTFLLVGLWHGATVGYMIYGLIHGIGLAYLAIRRGKKPTNPLRVWWTNSRFGYVGGVFTNYLYVSLSFVFFALTTKQLGILAARIGG